MSTLTITNRLGEAITIMGIPGGEIRIPPLSSTQLEVSDSFVDSSTPTRKDLNESTRLQRLLSIGAVTVSPVGLLETESTRVQDYLIGRQVQQQFIDNTTDTYGITLSAGAGSVVLTVGVTDSSTRKPIPFTDVAKVGLKMITNNDPTAVIKINGTTVVAGGVTVQANIVNGKVTFTINVSGASGTGTTLTFDSQDVESNGLITDTATVILT